MVSLESLAIVVVLCTVLSVLSYRFGLLTASGSAASFLVGMAIGGLGSIGWLLTLVVFVFMGFAVTKFRFQIKESKGLQEGKKGERTYRNVLANGLAPALVAIIAFASGTQDSTLAVIAYISSVAVAAADTTASELGVLSDRTYLITTGQRVPPGTDGGVSLMGTFWCIVASGVASYTGWLVIFHQPFDPLVLIPTAMGVAGCMVDSLIGATLERRGVVGKLHVNFMSMAFGSVAAVALYLLL
ncbi:MAG: DUF92 domain-containing protein [Methanomassiliicoccus sp.]|nr:DUF92 domain-containing protein [Methanomassiliicoccus sp.]